MKMKLLVAIKFDDEVSTLENFFIEDGQVYEGTGPRQFAYEPDPVTDETWNEIQGVFVLRPEMLDGTIPRDRFSTVIVEDAFYALFLEVDL